MTKLAPGVIRLYISLKSENRRGEASTFRKLVASDRLDWTRPDLDKTPIDHNGVEWHGAEQCRAEQNLIETHTKWLQEHIEFYSKTSVTNVRYGKHHTERIIHALEMCSSKTYFFKLTHM